MPEGLASAAGERGSKLSMGQRQLVALARVFLQDPAILILDEATASVDPLTETLIQEGVDAVMASSTARGAGAIGSRRKRTSIVIAHRLSTVRSLDRLLVFEKGRIAEEGTHETLVNRDGGIYRRLFERQALELTKGLRVA